MLSDNIREALRALKDQATAATAQLESMEPSHMRAELADAHRRMSPYPKECSLIAGLVWRSQGLSIPSLTEEKLGELMTMVDRQKEFKAWLTAVETEARRVLNRPTEDVTWLIGGPEDMRRSFISDESPAEYVQAQIDSID